MHPKPSLGIIAAKKALVDFLKKNHFYQVNKEEYGFDNYLNNVLMLSWFPANILEMIEMLPTRFFQPYDPWDYVDGDLNSSAKPWMFDSVRFEPKRTFVDILNPEISHKAVNWFAKGFILQPTCRLLTIKKEVEFRGGIPAVVEMKIWVLALLKTFGTKSSRPKYSDYYFTTEFGEVKVFVAGKEQSAMLDEVNYLTSRIDNSFADPTSLACPISAEKVFFDLFNNFEAKVGEYLAKDTQSFMKPPCEKPHIFDAAKGWRGDFSSTTSAKEEKDTTFLLISNQNLELIFKLGQLKQELLMSSSGITGMMARTPEQLFNEIAKVTLMLSMTDAGRLFLESMEKKFSTNRYVDQQSQRPSFPAPCFGEPGTF